MIDLSQITPNSSGFINMNFSTQINDIRGLYCAEELVLPDFDKFVYYAAPASTWPVACCYIHPFVSDNFDTIPEGGMFILLKNGKEYIGILPLGQKNYMSWFIPDDGKLKLAAGSLGSDLLVDEQPVAVWATSDNPYKVFAETYKKAALINPHFKLRNDKSYPEIFEYLGWCSWEEYFRDINEELLCKAVEKINNSSAPVRYMLIDDGHQDFVNPEDYFNRRLRSFKPDKTKFPNGFTKLLTERTENGISWFGLWLPFAAGMCGIGRQDNLTAISDDCLVDTLTGGALPTDKQNCADEFMGKLLESANEFDFVKIDFMSFPIAYYAGSAEWRQALQTRKAPVEANPYRAAWRMNKALEDNLEPNKLELMNCNNHGAYNLSNMAHSNSSRCSGDYVKGNPEKAREHIFQSYANMPWLEQLCWGDHDMFHSCDEFAGRIMAVSKALSGGPIYLSDAPEDFQLELIKPLCYEDGKLLRPLAPAVPLPESLFLEYNTPEVKVRESSANHHPFRAIAPLVNNSAALVAYNLANDQQMTASVSLKDYRSRNAMLQNSQADSKEPELLLWDWYEQKTILLKDEYAFELNGLSDRLLLLIPIQENWAVLGRFDKFLGPEAVRIEKISAKSITLVMKESGPLAIWLTNGIPQAEGVSFEPQGDDLFIANLPIGEKDKKLLITRC
jgi:hypothetical protein